MSDRTAPSEDKVKRCKHPNARVVEIRGNSAKIRCEDCGPLELWCPVVPRVSNHACRRIHKAPKWAQKLIEAELAKQQAVTS